MSNKVESKNWIKAELGDVAHEVRDLHEPKTSGDLAYIGLEHIEQQALQLSGIGSSSETVSTKKIFKSGDILFGSLRPYFRKVVMPKFDGVCSTDITVIRAKQDTNQVFLFYFIANQAFIDHASSISSGTRMPRANWKVLAKDHWLFPPIKSQSKIAFILSGYDDLIENNNRRIKILEEMAQAIYKEWFVNFRFPGHEKVKMIKSKIGLIPEGWEVKQLGNSVLEIIDYRGKTPKKLGEDWSADGIPALSALNIKSGKLVNLEKNKFTSEKLYQKWMKIELDKGDILMTSEAPLGELYYLSKKRKFCLSQRLFAIRAHTDIVSSVLLFLALSNENTQMEISSRATGATVAGIRQSLLREVPILIPSRNIQEKYTAFFEKLILNIEVLCEKNMVLRKTRDFLLPKLISGEIDVEKLSIAIEGQGK